MVLTNPRHKTVLFFPLNSPGHINSSLGIADRMRREFGHRTVFLVLGKMMSGCVRQHGHELVQLEEANIFQDYEIEPDEDPSELDEQQKEREGKRKRAFEGAFKWPQILMRYQKIMQLEPVEAFLGSCELMENLMVRELIDNHDSYARALERLAPDMIVIDAYYVPPCIVNLKHIPWVRLYSANPLAIVQSKLPHGLKPAPMCGFRLFDKETRSRMRRDEPSKWQAMLDEWRRASERIFEGMSKAGNTLQQFLVSQGCEPLPPGQQAHDSPHLNIYMYPQALDYDQDDDLFEYAPRWFRSDSLVRASQSAHNAELERVHAEWAARIERASGDKEHVVLFSLGSLASGNCSLMRRYVDMLAADQRRLYVVSKGVNGDQFELNASNMIGANYIPQTLVLERAQLAIVHGGNNSVTECMYYGLPMIVLPVFADQLDNAQRVEDLGLGKRLDVHRCTRDQLLAAVTELLGDEQLLARVRAIGESMRACKDLAKISLMLNKLVTQKTLEQDFVELCRRKSIDEIEF